MKETKASGYATKKWPFIQWFVCDWLGDPAVTRCATSTRGILFDWLCNMHLLDRSGQITGAPEELARLGRCSAIECEAALHDLERTHAADVTRDGNGSVTVTNRRMNREYLRLKSGRVRVDRHRSNGSVTPHNQSPYSQNHNSQPQPTCPTNPTGPGRDGAEKRRGEERIDLMSLDRLAAEIMANRWEWFYDNCKVKITDFTRASLMTVLRPYVGKVTERTVERAWKEAIRRAHGAAVDELVTTTPAGYAITCFRELLDKEIAGGNRS